VSALAVSVIVVSRGRPKHLQHCLKAILQIRYHPFEIIVVADRTGLDAVVSAGLDGQVKSALCDVANISVARNIGLRLAAGTVVAFLDDDCVPEPGWLFHLAAVFDDPQVDAAGGYVLGRNGISYQTTAQTIDQFGMAHPLDVQGDAPAVMDGRAGCAISTRGTNCAFRRRVFEELGGFDPAFSYYLDESDLNMRLARAGKKTAIVPLAVVHHGTHASVQRLESRVPATLFQVGNSTAIFQRKHAVGESSGVALANALQVQKSRLLRYMVSGDCEPGDVGRLLDTMKAGFAAGQGQEIGQVPVIPVAPPEFLPVKQAGGDDRHRVVAGYRIYGKSLRRRAREMARSGGNVSLYLFSRTALFHRVRFHPDGYWEQAGGLFGRAVRSEPVFRVTSLRRRVAVETQRIAKLRHPWDTGAGKHDDQDISF